MQPVKAAQLLARMCESGTDASKVRQWHTWQPVFEANWQLADSLLAAYLQQCKETKQRPLKDSESMAALLSSQPSRYRLLRVPDVHSRVALLQQQLGLTAAEAGQLVAGGLAFSGPESTVAAAIQWLVSFAGSREAAADMLRAAPSLVCISAATLDSKVAALQAAWAGALQPGQVRQLVQRSAMVLFFDEARYQPAADVLRGWFPQFDQLLTAVTVAPHLLGASADILQANERWFLGPPLSLSSQQFLARVRAAPQAFFQNLASANTQHKLAFLTQVGSVPLERALSASHLTYLKSGLTALAGRYFLLAEHGVPVPRHKDGGIGLSYATKGLPRLLRFMRQHDSEQQLPAEDDAALSYIDSWLKAWPQTESGQRWHCP